MKNLLVFIRKHIIIIFVALFMLLIGSLFGPSQAQVEEKDTQISSQQKEIESYKKSESEHLAAIDKLEKENKTYKDAEAALKKKEDALKEQEEAKAAQAKKKKEEEAVAKEAEELAAKKKAEEEEAKRVADEKAATEQAAAEKAEAAASSASSSQSSSSNTSPAASTSAQTQFANCTELRTVHPGGVPKGHAAYQSKMDRDKDDYACEN